MTQTKQGELTAWKGLTNPDYIGAYMFQPGERKVVQILSVALEEVVGDKGKKQQCIVAKLKDEKPMILNKTNCKTIQIITGSKYIEHWRGIRITLYVDDKVQFGKDIVEGLRIEKQAPPLPEMTPTHEKWKDAVANVRDGKTTIEAIKKFYKMTEDTETQFKNDLTDHA